MVVEVHACLWLVVISIDDINASLEGAHKTIDCLGHKSVDTLEGEGVNSLTGNNRRTHVKSYFLLCSFVGF